LVGNTTAARVGTEALEAAWEFPPHKLSTTNVVAAEMRMFKMRNGRMRLRVDMPGTWLES
jgi:hypothetical protein